MNKKPTPTKLSWYDLHIAMYKLHEDIRQYYNYNVIVAPSRGGLIPGVILSHIANRKLLPVCYSSKLGNGDGNESNKLPHIDDNTDAKLLILDDICDTGHTMAEMSHFYTTLGHKVETAAIYWRVNACVEPSFYEFQLRPDDPWVIFPWE